MPCGPTDRSRLIALAGALVIATGVSNARPKHLSKRELEAPNQELSERLAEVDALADPESSLELPPAATDQLPSWEARKAVAEAENATTRAHFDTLPDANP